MLASMPNLCNQLHEFSPQVVSQLPVNTGIADIKKSKNRNQNQLTNSPWPILQPYSQSINNTYTFNDYNPSFDCYSSQQPLFNSSSAVLPIQSGHTSHFCPCQLESDQETPRTVTNLHNRESSLSSLGSAGPASPYTANISNPQIVGEIFDFNDIPSFSGPKLFTPAPTPLHENLLVSQYPPSFQSSPNLSLDMLPMPEMDYQDRGMVKYERVMTEVYGADGLYNPNVHFSAAPSPSTSSVTTLTPSKNEIFDLRLQHANNQHLSTNSQTPLSMPTRECTPFCKGSPMAPKAKFGTNSPSLRIGTAFHLREQQKAENDARVLQEQLHRGSTTKSSSNTISPKDVDLVYQEDSQGSLISVFQPQQKMPNVLPIDSSTFSSSQPTLNQSNNFTFTLPVVEQNVKCMPQQCSFLPAQPHLQINDISKPATSFQASQALIEQRRGNHETDSSNAELKKPARTSANTGTYTCTYHGCTLRFDTPARLQRHKRENHRSSSAATVAASTPSGLRGHGMTSTAHRNSQAGPHRCDRINPSTGKPCNTIFSRPYDLTRHEDTIHNTQKQKVYCPLCEDEKSFSRNDALTRHMRVVHPDFVDTTSRRRRGPSR